MGLKSFKSFKCQKVSNISNSISCFKTHPKVSNKQLLWWVWKVWKVTNSTSHFKSHLKVWNKWPPHDGFEKFQVSKVSNGTSFSSLIWKFQISNSSFKKFQKVSNSTFHFKSHLKVSNQQQMRLETRCAISALHKANWLPCWCCNHAVRDGRHCHKCNCPHMTTEKNTSLSWMGLVLNISI